MGRYSRQTGSPHVVYQVNSPTGVAEGFGVGVVDGDGLGVGVVDGDGVGIRVAEVEGAGRGE